MKDYDKAIEYHQKSLNIERKQLGEEHVLTALSYWNLGLDYELKGNKDLALSCFEKAYNIYKKLFGETHPNTQDTLTAISDIKK